MVYQELKLKCKDHNLGGNTFLLLFLYYLLATVHCRTDSVIACSSGRCQYSKMVSKLLMVLHSHVWDMNSSALPVHQASIVGPCVRLLVLPAVHLEHV